MSTFDDKINTNDYDELGLHEINRNDMSIDELTKKLSTLEVNLFRKYNENIILQKELKIKNNELNSIKQYCNKLILNQHALKTEINTMNIMLIQKDDIISELKQKINIKTQNHNKISIKQLEWRKKQIKYIKNNNKFKIVMNINNNDIINTIHNLEPNINDQIGKRRWQGKLKKWKKCINDICSENNLSSNNDDS